jgi:hypothetical protein
MLKPMDDELERSWKETIVAYCKVISQLPPGGTKEFHENSQFG